MVAEQQTAEVTLTESAAEAFRSIISKKGVSEAGMKLAVGPGGCGGYEYLLGLARKPKPTDIVTESQGITLFLDTKTLHLYNGCIVDFKDGLMGEGFAVSNPKSKADCACGQSFKISGEGEVDSGACTSVVAGRS